MEHTVCKQSKQCISGTLHWAVSALVSLNHYSYSTMPAEQHAMHQHNKHSNDPKQEDRIQMAIEGVSAGKYSSYKAASIQMKVK